MTGIILHKTLEAATGKMQLKVDFKIEDGEFLALYGPSGAGKTSLLRMISGLMKPEGGKVVVGGETWYESEKNICLPPQKRRTAYVFQQYALFPNMTVLQNLEYASPEKGGAEYLQELLRVMQLQTLSNRYPATLSGGQQQRVALARALAQKPRLLLLDEPLAALDRQIRSQLQAFIRECHTQYGLTTILVSHDPGEVIRLSDRVIIMENGQISRSGSPEEVFINQGLSGKIQLSGEILSIRKQEVVYIVTVLVQANTIQVVAMEEEIRDLAVGDSVMIAAKAFNPLLYKIGGAENKL